MNAPNSDFNNPNLAAQQLVNAILDSARVTRQDYHLTLGGLIERLQLIVTVGHDADKVVATSDSSPVAPALRSYRGYYSDCAIEPAVNGKPQATAGSLLAAASATLGQSLKGYKGGQFLMDADTPLWVSGYGDASGLAIVWMVVHTDAVVLVTRKVK